MTRPLTLAVFTKNRVNPAYAAARLAADRVAAEAGARTMHYVPADARRCRPAEGPGRRGAGRRARRRGVRAGRRPADGARPGALCRCRHPGRDLHQSHGGQGRELRRLRRRRRGPHRGQGPDRRPGWRGRAASSPSRARRRRRPAATGPSACKRPWRKRRRYGSLGSGVGYFQQAPAREEMARLLAEHARDRRRLDVERRHGLRRPGGVGRRRPDGQGGGRQRPARGDRQHRARHHAGQRRFQRLQHRRHRRPAPPCVTCGARRCRPRSWCRRR